MKVSPNKKPLGWAYIVLFLFLSCGRRDIPINPDPTTNVQQTLTDLGQDRDTPLHEAILAQTDLASLYPFLQATTIDQPDNEGNTLLHRAVIQDNLPLVGLLLSEKAAIDAQNEAGLMPLHLAAKQGNLLTLHLLLIYRADIHAKDKEGHTPLDYINEKQHTDQLQQLLQRTPWDTIARERDPFVVAWLLAAEKTQTKDIQGWTPLHLAACLGQVEAIQDLIANKADIEAKNNHGWTPLHLAAFLGQIEAIQVLLDNKAATETKDHKGCTPLHLATFCGKPKAIQVLLAAKAAIEAKSNRGRTPLHLGALGGQPEAIQVLLSNQATIETKDNRGCTSLHLSAFAGKSEAIQGLLANKAAIETKSNKGRTPLHLAALAGQTEAIQVLLANKVATEAKDNQGQTSLHRAALAGQLEAVQLLINHQAPVDAIDHKGRTPYDIAESAAVKKLLGSRMDLSKLVFNCDYDHIGKRIVAHLTAREQGQLRQTCTEMGWNLLQKGDFHLQVTPDKLPHIQPYLHPRLYPHTTTSHCVCPIFDPIPADAVVRGAFDLEQIVKNKHLSIKNVVFKGGVATLEPLRAALPAYLVDHLIVPVEILAKEEARLARKKAAVAAQEASLLSDSPAEEVEEEPIALDEEESSENPYLSSNLQELEPLYEEPSQNDYGVAENPYGTTSQPADQPQYVEEDMEEDMESSSSEENKFSDDEEKKLSDNEESQSSEDTVAEEPKVADPGNQLYNSFLGVKKLPAGKITIGKYLAAGAFGKVFRGQWGDKAVALKQIDLNHAATKIGIDPDEVKEAMQWEVTRLSTANHPNLVQFYGLYQDGEQGYTYMVMEFCDGGTMQDALKKDVRWSQRWQWALQISEALAYLHREGVLHRDLKAENILLDRNGTAKLADLGVAQVDALLQEKAAQVVETGLQDKRFIAPEVETNQTLSTKATDIYALGLVFWQIATGKVPKKIEDLDSVEKDDWREGREREEIPKDCPKSIKALILECWAKEPNQRPTAQGVLAKLAALGPELDPYHHYLVTAAQKLEQLVHPKRKEGLAYVPPFVTQYSVDESIETYWNRVEAAKVKTAAAKTEVEVIKAKEEANANPPLTLAETFKEFIETPDKNTLLLLGEAGLGKTLTTYQWGDQLLKQWWVHINTGTPAPAYFPLFIRPELPKWSHGRIKDSFQEVAREYNLPKGIQPLVFIDGYDELQSDAEPSNLVDHLGLSVIEHAKLIVTCRPRTVEQSAQGARFGFNGVLTTRHFLPFSLDQLLGYLEKELAWDEKVSNDYKSNLANAEGVRTVLRNPFVLHLFRESWATLFQRPLNQLNRWQIYEGFIEHSIKAQQLLLAERVQKRLQGSYPDLLASYQAFMSRVAGQAFQQKAITLGVEEAKGISPWADLPRYVEEVAKDEFAERKAKLQIEINQASEEKKTQLSRRSLLNEGDYVSLNQKRMGQAEAELPLKRRGEHYEYSHKSLFEYGMAKRLLLLKNSPRIVEEGIGLLNSRKIQEEPEALQFWQEGWKEPGSKALIEPFFALITESRDNEAIQQASANSATLLAKAAVAFSGRALQGVWLPGADLSGGVLYHTNLAGAQLPGALLRETYLRNADLRSANLSGVDFGQHPSLKCKEKVTCLSYNRAGTQLAVGLDNGDIELYNQAEGAYMPLVQLKGHSGLVRSVCYRPDGQQLASGSDDNTVGLWDVQRQQLLAQLKGHSGVIWSVCYRPDGQQLASGSDDHTVGLWDPYRQQLQTLLKGHSDVVRSVCYRPDGQQLASGSDDHTVGLWDVHAQQLIALLKGHTDIVRSVTYRPDGQQLASGSNDKTVGLWNPQRQQLISLLKGHYGKVYNVTYRPDGQQLASGNEDWMIGLWDPHRQQLISLLKGHTGSVWSVTYRSDGQQLASGSDDKTVGLWDPRRQQLISRLQGHTNWVMSVTYRPDGQQLASGGGHPDNMVGLWDPHRQQLLTMLKGHSGGVRSVCYRPNSQQLASGSEDNTVGLWDPTSQQLLGQLEGHSGGVNSVCYHPDGQQLASGSKDNTVGLWDPYPQQLIWLLKGHTGSVRSVTYRPDGQQLASGSEDKTVGLWDPQRQQLISLLKGHVGSVNSVTYRPDGQQLASGSEDKTVGLWDPQRQQLQTQLKGHRGGVNSVCYRPDGQQLASGSEDKTVGLWDIQRQQLISLLKGHVGSVISVTYRPDGQQLASGSNDCSILVWARQDTASSLKENWQLIRRFENGARLLATDTLLKGTILSVNNRALLKQKGAEDDSDEQLLHKAAQEGNIGIIQILVQSKANLETKDEAGHTPLHIAAENGHTATVQALIQSKANLEAKDEVGHTPLHMAAQKGHVGATHALLQANASIDKKMIDDNMLLHKAIQEYHPGAIQLLLQTGANIEAANEDGLMPLHIAAKNGYTRAVEDLLQARANIEAANKNGRRPLHIVAQEGHTGAMGALIQARANIDVTDTDGLTPLHIVAALKLKEGDKNVKNDQIDAVQRLLSGGANKDITNHEGKNPYDLVPDGQTELKNLLSPGE